MFTKHISRIVMSTLLALSILAVNIPATQADARVPISIGNNYADPVPFYPVRENVTIYYNLPQRVDSLIINVVKMGVTVKQLYNNMQYSGDHVVEWNGIYNGQQAPRGEYTYQILAQELGSVAEAYGRIRVEYDNPIEQPVGPVVQPVIQPVVQPVIQQAALVSVNPSNLAVNFGNVRVGSTKSETITLRNLGNTSLYFYTLAFPSDIFQSSTFLKDTLGEAIYIAPGNSYSFTVSFTPTSVGYRESTLTLRTNDTSNRNINMLLSGTGTSGEAIPSGVADIALNKSTISFGDVSVNTVKSETLEIKNTGDRTLEFTLSQRPTNGFSTNLAPDYTYELGAGSTMAISVSFTPDSQGAKQSFLLLYTNDPDESSVIVNLDGKGISGGQTTSDLITNYGPSASEFNPWEGEHVEFRYRVNVGSSVTFVVDGVYLENSYKNAGTYSINWDGRGANGNILDAGTYAYAISAYDSNNNSDREEGSVRITRNTSGEVVLQNFSVSPKTFDPNDDERVTFDYYLSRDSYITLYIYDDDSDLVNTIEKRELQGDGHHKLYWDGTDEDEDILEDGTYKYEFQADPETSNLITITKRGNLVIDTDGGSSKSYCAGFTDVRANDPLCPAVKYVKDRKIFLGDDLSNEHSSKTLRLNDPLNRAEAAAVLLRAMRISLLPYNRSSDGDLGFWDLDTNQWYMSPFKTAIKTAIEQRYENHMPLTTIMSGYPDNSMKPFRAVKRGELYKIFIEAAFNSTRVVADFFLDRDIEYAVFSDTPPTYDRLWYLPYADWLLRYFNNTDFAGRYFNTRNLDSNLAQFRAGESLTRGEVVELIYQTYKKNLIDY